MIAVDTNILVYAHRGDSAFHGAAFEAVRRLAEADTPWAIPWPSVHEFIAIVTHSRIYSPPTPLSEALTQVHAWMDSPSVTALGEPSGVYFGYLRHLLEAAQATGPRVHNARIAALCLSHGVDELWTADRDYSRFPGLTVRNPVAQVQ
ncbi:MAG: PIN domain-containing protein [Spirochaetes bacterium]|jgi:toxin-antitoxin system PIN domain toxin|nr:PIN domain-containing protein [Spirochaetota bacterium]